MHEKITVFDESNREAGKTFYRRARQLVAKGRAAWLDEGRTSLRLISRPDKETAAMKYDTINIESEKHELLFAAKSNVRRKRSLVWHIIAFIVAAPLILMLFQGFLHRVLSSNSVLNHGHEIERQLNELNLMAFRFSSAGDTESSAIVAQAARDLVASYTEFLQFNQRTIIYSTSAYDTAWSFAWGAYFAWGIFVFSRFVLYFLPKIRQRESRQVSIEYQRLQKNSALVVDKRYNA